jgi:hypothetical protein
MKKIKFYWETKPIESLLIIGFLARLIAVFFSRGFGMFDDHFLVIESAQSWVDGTDYNDWLPWSPGNSGPTGHSFLYSGIHFVLFYLMKLLYIQDAQIKMVIIRLLHALWSLLVILYSYKITQKISNEKNARSVGLLMALYWFFPWISVRNLVEVVIIPLLIWALWILIKNNDNKKFSGKLILAGILLGLAFSIRFQSALFIIGVGLALLILKNWRAIIGIIIGFILTTLIFQGLVDWLLWGKPFSEMRVYIQYNIDHSKDYIVSSWYTYLLLIGGILIPPVSIMIFSGFISTWRKHILIFLPTFIFLLFHSIFPNKQERFILTIIPFIILLGIIGWNEIADKIHFIKKSKKLFNYFWVFFWIINLILLPIVSSHYSKRARIEAMRYISGYLKNEKDKLKYDTTYFLLTENSNASSSVLPPEFYLEHWIKSYDVNINCSIDSIYNSFVIRGEQFTPRFFLFEENKRLEERVASVKKYFPNIEYETTVEPGFIDELICRLNPINANQSIIIYRNKDFYPNKLKQ